MERQARAQREMGDCSTAPSARDDEVERGRATLVRKCSHHPFERLSTAPAAAFLEMARPRRAWPVLLGRASTEKQVSLARVKAEDASNRP
jgi:hypothetical protein